MNCKSLSLLYYGENDRFAHTMHKSCKSCYFSAQTANFLI